MSSISLDDHVAANLEPEELAAIRGDADPEQRGALESIAAGAPEDADEDEGAIDADGNPVLSNGVLATETVNFLGMAPSVVAVRQPVTAVPGVVWDYLSRTASVVTRIPEKMVGVAQAVFERYVYGNRFNGVTTLLHPINRNSS